jgi:hypothetical protein
LGFIVSLSRERELTASKAAVKGERLARELVAALCTVAMGWEGAPASCKGVALGMPDDARQNNERGRMGG